MKKIFNFVDLYFDDDEHFSFLDFCNKRWDNGWFITTRIDNDDMIAENYIDQVQEYANHNLRTCILSFEEGMKYDLKSQKEYKYNRKDNHFLSMIGSKENCILQYNHSKILNCGKEVVFLNTNQPMWIEIIHDSNVINTIKDKDIEIR